ncbi:MAG: hypothetical protein D3904_03055 [Candidatus Electrothrix sp. EH2]|nr:hypothetical protein [Candidatus Electrothrix sp. EH2]
MLQENIICRFIKGNVQETVTVRSSNCDTSINNTDEEQYHADLIIDSSNKHRIIRIPESAYEASILRQAETFQTSFEAAGYFISTGRVVEHRARKYSNLQSNTWNTRNFLTGMRCEIY